MTRVARLTTKSDVLRKPRGIDRVKSFKGKYKLALRMVLLWDAQNPEKNYPRWWPRRNGKLMSVYLIVCEALDVKPYS